MDSSVAAGFSLEPLGESNGLGLDADIGVERLYLGGTGIGHLQSGDAPVVAVRELLYGDGSRVAATAGECAVVVEKVGAALVINHSRMICEGATGSGHHYALVGPGTGGGGSGRVADILGAAVGGEDVIVRAIALVHPGAFGELGAECLLSGGDGDDAAGVRDHVLIQFDVVNTRVAPVHVGLAVVVDHDCGVDVAVGDKGLADRVFVRAGDGVAHADADAVGRASAGHGRVEVKLAVALDGLGSPGVGSGPAEGFEGHDDAVIAPVNHVSRRIQAPVLHVVVGRAIFVVVGKQPDRVVVHERRRIRAVNGLDDGVVGERGLEKTAEGDADGCDELAGQHFRESAGVRCEIVDCGITIMAAVGAVF